MGWSGCMVGPQGESPHLSCVFEKNENKEYSKCESLQLCENIPSNLLQARDVQQKSCNNSYHNDAIVCGAFLRVVLVEQSGSMM